MRRALSQALQWNERFLHKRLGALSRLWILAATACLVFSFFFPLWHINLVAPQYPEGLDLWIYSYQISAGNEGQDLEEINILNHYIGMRRLERADFVEMTAIPFALGLFVLIGLRSVVFGLMSQLVDLIVLYLYFCLFSGAGFIYRMYSYGHHLDPKAPINPEPFWPALFGTKQIANMTQTSLPSGASYLLMAALAFMLLAMIQSWRQQPFYDSSGGATP